MYPNKLLEVSDGVFEAVAKSLGYSSTESMNDDVKNVRRWMVAQPHFPEIMDDKRIQNFLILNKGSVERSKEKIENYYSVRSQLPEIFDEINPKLHFMDHVFETHYLVPLPKLTKNMHRVFVYKFRKKKLPENFDPIQLTRHITNLYEIRLVEDVMYGDVFVMDGENMPINILLYLTPSVIYRTLVMVYQKVFSMRVKAVYLINAPSFTDKLLIILKTILKPKIMDRIQNCPNIEFLREQLGREVLPADYGGEEKSLLELQQMVAEKYKEYGKHFDRLDGLRINEELKPPEVRDDGMFGLSGNFKKLEID